MQAGKHVWTDEMLPDWRDIDPWLAELRARHWTVHLYGDPKAPTLIGAVWHWEHWADVVILRGHDRAVAYRVQTGPDTDVFDPQWVSWWYSKCAVWTLRAILTLDPPTSADQARIFPAPWFGRIPPEERRAVTIRPT